MRWLWGRFLGLVALASLFLPEVVWAAGEKAAPIVVVADTRRFTGWEAWWSNLYNESRIEFTILTVIIIPVVGLIFGIIADLIMSRIGIDLKSRELSEH